MSRAKNNYQKQNNPIYILNTQYMYYTGESLQSQISRNNKYEQVEMEISNYKHMLKGKHKVVFFMLVVGTENFDSR